MRENNYASESLTINGAYQSIENPSYDGETASGEQLGTESFYTAIGFDFSESGPWEWNETRPILKGSAVDVPEMVYTTENDVINVGADETSRTLTWYSPASGMAKVQYAPTAALVDGQMPADAITLTAEPTPSTLEGRNIYRVQFSQLQENTQYTYRIGSETDGWTELRTFDTGSYGDFSFLFAGDPQIGSSGDVENDKSGWKNTLEKASESFPDASFLISLGDQVDNAASESEYSGFLSTGDFQSLPPGLLKKAVGVKRGHFGTRNIVHALSVLENYGDHFIAGVFVHFCSCHGGSPLVMVPIL